MIRQVYHKPCKYTNCEKTNIGLTETSVHDKLSNKHKPNILCKLQCFYLYTRVSIKIATLRKVIFFYYVALLSALVMYFCIYIPFMNEPNRISQGKSV